jgi:iron complex outermembrane receptor protein
VHDDNGGVSLQADWDFGGGYRLTSITAYRDWRNVQYQDYDELAAPIAGLPQVADTGHLSFQQTSQELRIASPKDRFIDYVVGLFALDSIDRELYQRADVIVGGATPGDYNGAAHYGSRDINYAAFGEADVNFTQSFRAIIGFREVSDELSYYHQRASALPVSAGKQVAVTGVATNFASTGSTRQDGQAGRVGLQYDVSKDITTYATFSRGYMGPAYNVFFNMAAVNTPVLKPETSNSYEIGIKSNLFDHKLQADLSAFVTDFYNYQANFTQSVAGGLVTNLINAGSVVTQGAEANVIAKPVHNLTLNADLAYDDAHVVSFPCPAGSPVTCNINGEPLPFAPKWKTHLEGDYRIPVTSAYDVSLETDYNWQSQVQYQLTETPNTIQPAYGVWNASVALLGKTNGWTARFLVKNILDQHYSPYLAGGNLGGLVRWVPRDDQRYVGINLHKDF